MRHELKRLFDSEPTSPVYVAINRVLVRNDAHLMRIMKQASAKSRPSRTSPIHYSARALRDTSHDSELRPLDWQRSRPLSRP